MSFQPTDQCECGDYYRDHDAKGCALCRNQSHNVGGACKAFVLMDQAWKDRLLEKAGDI